MGGSPAASGLCCFPGEHSPCPFSPSPLLPPQGITSLYLGHHSKARHSPLSPLPPQCGATYSKIFQPLHIESQRLIEEGSSTQFPRSQGPRAFQTVLTCWEPCQPVVWAGQGGSPRGLISCTHRASQLLRLSTPSWDADCPSVLCPKKGSVYKCLHLRNPGKFPH